MFLEVFLIFLSVFICFKFFVKKSRAKNGQENGVSTPIKAPPGKTDFNVDAKTVNGLLQVYDIVAQKNKDHGIGSFWFGPIKIVSVWEPELIEAVATNPATQTKGEFYQALFSSAANGLFSHPGGEEWRELQKPFVQSMAKKYLDNDYFNQFLFKTHDLIDFIKENRQGLCFDIGKEMFASVFDIFSATHVGVHINELRERKWQFAELIHEKFEFAFGGLLRFNYYIMKLAMKLKNLLLGVFIFISLNKESQEKKPDTNGSFNSLISHSEEDSSYISTFIEKIQAFIRLKSLSFLNFYNNKLNFGLTEEGRRCLTIDKMGFRCLEWLLEERKKSGIKDLDGVEYYSDFLVKRKEKNNFKPKKLLREFVDVVVAGSDTTPMVTSAFILFIAMHPEIQERLFKEQQEIFGDSDRDPTAEDLPKMKYLESVLKETLRHMGSPGFFKMTSEACVIGTYRIPKASILFVNLKNAHRNPKYFERPEEFYPDHFLPEVEAKRPRYAYVPFGVGARKCPGFLYANMLMKVMTSMIIRNFIFKTSVTMSAIKYNYRLLLEIQGGYPVEVNLRQCQ